MTKVIPSECLCTLGLTLLCLMLVALPAAAQDVVECQRISFDGETIVDAQIIAPVPGTEEVFIAPCPEEVEIRGFASTIGLPVNIEVYVIIDSSGSTAAASGADVDEDGILGIGDPSTDPDDSILASEVAAVRAFVHTLDPSVSRVSVIQFSNPEQVINIGERQGIVQSLTDDFTLVDAALNEILAASPVSAGATDYGGALNLLMAEYDHNHDAGAFPVALFLSDGVPTYPVAPWNMEDPGDTNAAINGAITARDRGITIHTFAVGTLFFPTLSTTLEEVALISGGTYTELLIPSEILDALPTTSLVGIRWVKVVNKTLFLKVDAELAPDGSFKAVMPIGQGKNELEIQAMADDDAFTEAKCTTDYTLMCLNPDNCFAVNEAGLICSREASGEFARSRTSKHERQFLADEDSDEGPDTGCHDPIRVDLKGALLFENAILSADDRVIFSVAGVTVVDGLLGDFALKPDTNVYSLDLGTSDGGRFELDFDKCRLTLKRARVDLGGIEPGVPYEIILRIGNDLGMEEIILEGSGRNLNYRSALKMSCCLAGDEDEDADEAP